MSQNVKTQNGWIQTSGNVNPKLIDDVNQKVDELQNEIEPIPFPITVANANISSMTNNSFKIGHYVHLSAYFKVTANIPSYGSLFTLSETPKYRVDGQVNGINNFITNVYNTNAIMYSNGSITASDDWRFIKADFCV